MCFLAKSRTWVQRISLGKNPLQRVDHGEFLGIQNAVQPPNHGAVEIPLQLVFAIRWQGQSRRYRHLEKTVMGDTYPVKSD